MSDLILPSYMANTQQPQEETAVEEVQEVPSEVTATQLPKPSGWKILCAVPEVEDTFAESAILRPTSFMKMEEHATTVLFVLRMGPDAYADEAKYSKGPWCKEGDFVLVRAYSGTRFKIHGKEFRMINDDQVEAVVEDPRGYSRAA